MVLTRDQKIEITEIIQETVSVLLNDERFINKIADKVFERIESKMNQHLQEMEASVAHLIKENESLSNELDKAQQYSRRTNIRIFGLDEVAGENIEACVINAMKDKVNVTSDMIDRCHRIGRLNKNKPRAIIVKFVNYKYKEIVFKNKKLFKGTKIIITEDLTKNRYDLFKSAREKYGIKNVWTYDGIIKVNTSKSIISIKEKNDLV
ncbi:hypothetical protein RN001_015974 [Aquatica leii]|uniref:Uncharacterized protein n=1 Tax=Aquatica leii TaxID=1421715 RepID=A0AAN7PXX5_9COLE|nr:hypothetical protein RN001_015974 [Aquatica leii]